MKKIIDQKVKSEKVLRIVVMEVENESVEVENSVCPDIRLKEGKGFRVNFIRFIYALCCLGFFVNSKGEKLSQIDVFRAFGQFLGMNLSNYSNDLSQPKRTCTEMDKQTDIFEQMKDFIRKRCGIF